MARPRFIYPDVWADPAFGRLAPLEKLLFIGLISNADDDGRQLGEPAVLRSAIFPYEELSILDMGDLRDSVAGKCRNVLLYEVGGVEYIQLLAWGKYQKPKYRIASKFPPPPRRKTSKQQEKSGDNLGPNLDQTDPELSDRVVVSGSGSSCGQEEPAPAPPTPRKIDHIWDTLCVLFGEPSNDVERGVRNAAIKQLRQSLKSEGVDEFEGVDLIVQRASAWSYIYQRLTLTPTALAKHWTALGRPGNNGAIPQRKTGWRWVRGAASGTYKRDPEGTDQPPAEFLATVKGPA